MSTKPRSTTSTRRGPRLHWGSWTPLNERSVRSAGRRTSEACDSPMNSVFPNSGRGHSVDSRTWCSTSPQMISSRYGASSTLDEIFHERLLTRSTCEPCQACCSPGSTWRRPATRPIPHNSDLADRRPTEEIGLSRR